MKLLHRYILRELLSPLLLGLVVFTFVLLLRELFTIINLIMSKGVAFWTVMQVFGCMIPQVLSLTIPMAILVGALLSFGRLSTDREIMAMRSSGINLFWLVTPAVLLGSVISLALGAMNMQFIPQLHTRLTDLQYQLLFQSITSLEPGRLYDDFSAGGQEMKFTFEQAGELDGQMRGVVIQSKQQAVGGGDERLLHIVAQSGTISPDLARRTIHIALDNGTVQLRNRGERSSIRVLSFDHMDQYIRPELRRIENGRYRKPPTEMRFSELGRAIAAEQDDDRRNDLIIERYRRWVFPFAALTFTLIGIPFGILTRTSGKGLGLGISFVLILVYFGLMEWGSAIALTGSALTPLAMWSPNIVLGSVGLAMLWWVARK